MVNRARFELFQILIKQGRRLLTQRAEKALDRSLGRSGIVLLEGPRTWLLSATTNLVSLRLSPSHTVYVLPGETERAAVIARLANFGFEAEVHDYRSLATSSTRWFRGKSVVLSSPQTSLNQAGVPGRIDGALVRLLTSRSRKKVVVTAETTSEPRSREFADPLELSRWISQNMSSKPLVDAWLDELLLELLYERHTHLAEVRRLVTNSVWWQVQPRETTSILEALRNLSKTGLISAEKGGYYTSTRLGRLVVEGGLPISRSDIRRLQGQLEDERETEVKVDEVIRERLRYFEELVSGLIDSDGWTTVNRVAHEAASMHVTMGTSRGIARRLLEKMVARGELVRLTYRRGSRRPMFVYLERGSGWMADIFENRCGDCAFYAKVARRCRLWWALSRFNAAEVYSKRDSLSVVARDKLANSNITIGHYTTACDFFAPKKRDFPLSKAREFCLGCRKEIEAPVAKLVRCANCGTTYKPLASKILVSYNYEQIFKDRYFQISGTQPPDSALLLPGHEQLGKSDWRDLVVLYPYETVKLGTDGMFIQREQGGRSFQAYDEIYEIVDYGVLAPEQLSEIEKKRIRVVQRSIQEGGAGHEIDLYPSARFTENLRILGQDGEFRRRLSKSLLLSVIVATKRMADRGGQPLRVLVNRQLLEYERMLKDQQMTATRALAYEARVNNSYWAAYKTLLRYSGLDFRSRVRDRFVRELVDSPRARARGYSPANAGINYLHQRRLVQCRIANARAGIGWIGCEGLLHVAKRKPSIGLLLDLSDSFKLADREAFLVDSLNFKITHEDFVAKLGRQRLWFFFPSAEGIEKLERIGLNADEMRVNSIGKELDLMAAYQESVNSFVNAVDNRNAELFRPFIYGMRNELEWLEAYST